MKKNKKDFLKELQVKSLVLERKEDMIKLTCSEFLLRLLKNDPMMWINGTVGTLYRNCIERDLIVGALIHIKKHHPKEVDTIVNALVMAQDELMSGEVLDFIGSNFSIYLSSQLIDENPADRFEQAVISDLRKGRKIIRKNIGSFRKLRKMVSDLLETTKPEAELLLFAFAVRNSKTFSGLFNVCVFKEAFNHEDENAIDPFTRYLSIFLKISMDTARALQKGRLFKNNTINMDFELDQTVEAQILKEVIVSSISDNA
jgi:hypothetical protein